MRGRTDHLGFVWSGDGGSLVRLRVSPGAKRTSIRDDYGGTAFRLAVAAPPVDGKANAEIARFLSGVLGVRRSEVEVVRGSSSRDKTVYVGGIDAGRVREMLAGEGR